MKIHPQRHLKFNNRDFIETLKNQTCAEAEEIKTRA